MIFLFIAVITWIHHKSCDYGIKLNMKERNITTSVVAWLFLIMITMVFDVLEFSIFLSFCFKLLSCFLRKYFFCILNEPHQFCMDVQLVLGVSGSNWKIGEVSSNFSQFCCIPFRTNTFEKGMNLILCSPDMNWIPMIACLELWSLAFLWSLWDLCNWVISLQHVYFKTLQHLRFFLFLRTEIKFLIFLLMFIY